MEIKCKLDLIRDLCGDNKNIQDDVFTAEVTMHAMKIELEKE
jgi:hypothetical protein